MKIPWPRVLVHNENLAKKNTQRGFCRKKWPFFFPDDFGLLRNPVIQRTKSSQKTVYLYCSMRRCTLKAIDYILLFLRTIFGPICYVPARK